MHLSGDNGETRFMPIDVRLVAITIKFDLALAYTPFQFSRTLPLKSPMKIKTPSMKKKEGTWIMVIFFYTLWFKRVFFQVKIWFQNRRTKWKKIENITNAEAALIMKNKNYKPSKLKVNIFSSFLHLILYDKNQKRQ